MTNVRLSVKLVGGFIMVAVITLAVGVVGLVGIMNSQKVAQEIKELTNINAELLNREVDHLNWARKVGQFQRNEDMTTLEVEKNPHKCAFGKWYYSDKRKQAETEIPGIAPVLKELEEPHTRLHSSTLTLEKLLQKGKGSRGEALSYYQNETGAQLADVQKHLEEVRTKVQQHLVQEEKIANSRDVRIKMITVIGMILGAMVALALGIILSFSITRPLNRTIEGLDAGADQVRSASGQLASSSQQLAEGASQQAAAIEETSASLEEMSSMTKQNAEHAEECKILMREARKIVEKLNEHMNDMSEAIGKINRSSEDTVKIVKTIDEIAFQTNLLALNAAVEAARAGEAGAGFAVVADEVRNLAMRAAEAAKNTTDLIDNTIRTVKEGSGIMDLTLTAFQKNMENAGKVGEFVEEIAAASQEQAQGIQQIGKAVAEMDQVVQRNAANAEESASASEEMSAQAEQMKKYVEDMVSLVEGKKSNVDEDDLHAEASGMEIHTQGNSRPNQFKALSHKTSAAVHKGSNGKNTSNIRSTRNPDPTGRVHPEQIIPFEDEGFKDF